MKALRWGVLAAAAAMFGAAGGWQARPAVAQEGLQLGDEAPALDVMEWLKDGPVDLAALKGKNVVLLDIYSVNFRNTKEHVEKLNKLQGRFADKGLKIVGLFTDAPDDVKKWVAENEVRYSLGIDNLRNTCGTYGRGEPPVAAIIDKEGRIAWRGQVADDGAMVERVLSGKFDLEKAKKTVELEREMGRLWQTQDPEKIEPAADALLAHEPGSIDAIHVKKWCFGRKSDAKAWREWIAKHVAKMTEDTPLNSIAWELCTDQNLAWREPAAALAAARKAVELCAGKEASIVDTLARAYYECGLVDRAIETQKQAIAALPADTDESDRTGMQDVLAYYEACAAAGKSLKPDAPAKTPPAKPAPKKK